MHYGHAIFIGIAVGMFIVYPLLMKFDEWMRKGL